MKTQYTVKEANELIKKGEYLVVGADEKLLSSLEKGNWIGGTIPYFMSDSGGKFTKDELFVTILPKQSIKSISLKNYDAKTLSGFPADYPKNGVTFVIAPSATAVLKEFAEKANGYPNVFNTPLVGWISGMALADAGKVNPKVFNGLTGKYSEADAVMMHIELQSDMHAQLDIVNLFTQGNGDEIKFLDSGFKVKRCLINGKETNFGSYVKEKKLNVEFPLVANYAGAMLNVSFQSVNDDDSVSLYAPVFPDVVYKHAAPIANYEEAFNKNLSSMKVSPTFACNCILNYLYAKLENKHTGVITGPMTFGEIAYMLLNQTMVYVNFVKK